MTCIGWAAWAAFAFSVLVELIAVLRRRSAPRIRGLGGMQSLASFLIGGIVLLAPTAASAATVAPAVAATVSHTDGQGAHNTGDTPAPPVAKLQHTVTSATESPWELAQTYLGSGPRWRDIAALNPDIPELIAGDQYLPQGAVLTLPQDARLPVPIASASETADRPTSTMHQQGTADEEAATTYTVRPGDYLSKIAETELGDGDRWPELYEANRGSEQPYGHTFTDPDRIYPGQELALPGTVRPDQPGARTAPDRSTTSRTGQQNAPETNEHQATPTPEKEHAQGATPRAQQPQQSEPGAGAAGEQTREPTRAAPTGSTAADPGPSRPAAPEANTTPSAPTPTESTTTAAAPAGGQEKETSAAGTRAGRIGLGATGFLAAALVGSLAYRRMMQQRRRRRGHRIAMPSGRTAETERAMRSVDAGVELALLADALRTVALNLAQEGRPLPEITTVQLGARGVRLHLAEAVAPVAPFTAAPDESAQWWCPAGTRELLPAEELRDVDPPFPALAVLGEDEDGAIVLIDLEHVGALHLTGTGRLAFLRTLALSLALTPLAEQIEIAVAGEDTAPGLSMLDGNRVTPYPDLGDAVRVLEQHQAGQQQVLGEFGEEGSLSVARASEDLVEELWPLVVLADLDMCPDGEQSQGRLWQVLEAPVRSAMAIVTSSTVAPDRGGVWCVDTDAGELTVPGSGVRVRLVTVTEEEYIDVLELGLTADSPTDHPGPPLGAPEPHPVAPAVPYYNEEPAYTEAGTDPAGVSGPGGKGVRGPGLLVGLADLDDEPDAPEERPVDEGPSVHQESAAPLAPSAASSPGEVLPALVSTAKVSVRLPQPIDAGASGSVEERTDIPAKASADDAYIDADGDSGPLVCVLGPVELRGARGSVASNRRTLALELTAWLAFHPGANSHQLDEVIAPSGRVTRATRNSRIGDVRKWLGTNPAAPADTFYLPHMNQQPDKLYRLDGVRCDWAEFERLVHESHRTDGADAQQLLREALTLVRGRPFAGIPARRYTWAEPLCQDMVSAIVDAADDLAARCLKMGDARGALWAVARGLDAAREMECLWRHRFRALAMLGQFDDLASEVRELDALVLDLGTSVEEATEELLRQLESHR
ncbi:BTAD domain-containing putative transcriptional regulator [Streptomyces drozdowiczii]|uniref:BTAD domain-containing putative transcriptional regulator n=1 Tax=Streptomyces drozdowiczii TaxID=202862 RepID=UPI002245BE85|nr:BTAD domain-containing putative transcriptional regulator [Streptomyces drozdowiczii]MCX0247986.1 LysM peptidoglycan-binding domain-containing protein [Streptomyces drozdowiczii]